MAQPLRKELFLRLPISNWTSLLNGQLDLVPQWTSFNINAETYSRRSLKNLQKNLVVPRNEVGEGGEGREGGGGGEVGVEVISQSDEKSCKRCLIYAGLHTLSGCLNQL